MSSIQQNSFLICSDNTSTIVSSTVSNNSLSSNRIFSTGNVISANQPFTWTLRNAYHKSRCSTCFNSTTEKNLLKFCKSCKEVSYCGVTCQRVDWPQHKAECKYFKSIRDKVKLNGKILDDVLLLLRTCAVIDANGKTCNDICCSCSTTQFLGNETVITCGNDHINQLSFHKRFTDEMILAIQCVCKITNKSIENVSSLLCKFNTNNFGIVDDLMNCVAIGVYPYAALMNHSCTPNCILRYDFSSNGPLLKIVALNNITKGEELTHSYVDCTLPSSLRQQRLQDIYHFQCNCNLCLVRSFNKNNLNDGAKFMNGMDEFNGLFNEVTQFLMMKNNKKLSYQEAYDIILLRERVDSIRQKEKDYNNGSNYYEFVENLKTLVYPTSEIDSKNILAESSSLRSLAHEYYMTDENTVNHNDIKHQAPSELLEKSVALLEKIYQPFHFELYKVNCELLTAYLIEGFHLPNHPLLALQLFTLGDISVQINQIEYAKKIYTWTIEMLLITHGENSSLYNRALISLGELA
eukprot:gene13139-17607_t